MSNPFIFGSKIANPKYFVGREKELKKIFGFLNTEHTGQIQHISVVGERRIGKSSLLYHLTQVKEKHLNTPENYQILYIDLQRPQNHTVSGLLGYILEELKLTRPSKVTFERFYEIIEKEREKNGTWIVLLMDEFEKLTERTEEFTDDFYDSLRSLANNNLLGIITASQHSLRNLADQEKLTSPFFNIFHQLELGEFGEPETQSLLNRGKVTAPKFTDTDCQKIIKIAGNHPARLQIVANLVYEAKDSGLLNWKEIEKEAKNEPAFNANHCQNSSIKNKILSVFQWIFITLPQIIGKAFLQSLGREEIAESSAWVWGAIWISLGISIIFGILSLSTVTKYIRETLKLIN